MTQGKSRFSTWKDLRKEDKRMILTAVGISYGVLISLGLITYYIYNSHRHDNDSLSQVLMCPQCPSEVRGTSNFNCPCSAPTPSP